MQLIDLGKLRFNFAGEWLNTAVYEPNDVVKYGGNVYVYTYALKTSANLPTDSGYWALMVEGFKFKGVYSAATQYRIGDGVAHGGKVYIAIKDGTAQTPPNEVFWSQFADGIQYEGTYSNTGQYQKNDVVMYGGSVYIAKQDTTNNLPSAGAFWGKFVEGISPKGVYNAATAYVEGDLAAYGANLYRAKGDTTGNLPTVTANWELLLSGFTFLGNWSAGSAYKPNEIVQYGGNSYVALLAHASTDFVTDLAAARWQKFNSGIRWRGIWTPNTAYLPDDIVTDGVSTFIAKSAFTSGAANPATDGVDPTAGAKWTLLALGAGPLGGVVTGTVEFLTGLPIAGAATIDLDTASGNRVTITGSGWTCDAVTLTRGPRTVIFDGVGTLAFHATANNLNSGGRSIITAAGDICEYRSDGVITYGTYFRANGEAITARGLAVYTYDDRANIRALNPVAGTNILIEGIGQFLWLAGSTELDDDESVFATPLGAWVLQAVGPDYVDARINDLIEFEITRISFVLPAVSLVLNGSILFTAPYPGATVNAVVSLTPPLGWPSNISATAYVISPNEVTIALLAGVAGSAATGDWVITIVSNNL